MNTINQAVTHLVSAVQRRHADQDGASMVEYGILVGLIAVVVIGAVATLGGTIGGWFGDINSGLTTTSSGA